MSCRGKKGLKNSSESPSCAHPLILLFWCWYPHYPPHKWDQMCPCSTTPSTWGAVGVHGVKQIPRWNSFKEPQNGAVGLCGAVQAQEHS